LSSGFLKFDGIDIFCFSNILMAKISSEVKWNARVIPEFLFKRNRTLTISQKTLKNCLRFWVCRFSHSMLSNFDIN
jgi:hypothetical protein